ncbi:MAG: hypothetical protein IPK19_23005 [Chloroflexi bacterium]|nr:hypothetical protein [Chloroflexota bacterium]
MRIILLGIVLISITMIGFGVSRTPLALGAPVSDDGAVAAVNATAMGLMQAKVPPDLHGRVMAVLTQFSTVLIPLAYLLVGPLADTIVEPAVGQPGWEVFAPLVGATPGSGMGLIMVAAGALLVITTLAVYAVPYIRNAERTIPDYVPEGLAEAARTCRSTR